MKIPFLLSKAFLFFKQKYIFSYSWLEKYFFKISKNFAEADTKKHGYASAKPSALADCRGEFRTLHMCIKQMNGFKVNENKRI